jgi:hypothetical protein
MDPLVGFSVGSAVAGTAFFAPGLTERMAYKMLNIVRKNN